MSHLSRRRRLSRERGETAWAEGSANGAPVVRYPSQSASRGALPVVMLDTTTATTMFRPVAARWSSPVARRAHNPKVTGSNPVRATEKTQRRKPLGFLLFAARLEGACRWCGEGHAEAGHHRAVVTCCSSERGPRAGAYRIAGTDSASLAMAFLVPSRCAMGWTFVHYVTHDATTACGRTPWNAHSWTKSLAHSTN